MGAMSSRRPRRRSSGQRQAPELSTAPTDWTRLEERARAQMERNRRATLAGELYASQAPSTYRLGSKTKGGTTYS